MDARRFAWSFVPLWAQALGAVLIALCMIVVWQTFRFNTFAAPRIRVQTDRKQRVITGGPYRIVRHPMYGGALLMFVGTPGLLVVYRPRFLGHQIEPYATSASG
jgi:protein-S-isoprenylcysteine O-methyltransferase Ste14